MLVMKFYPKKESRVGSDIILPSSLYVNLGTNKINSLYVVSRKIYLKRKSREGSDCFSQVI